MKYISQNFQTGNTQLIEAPMPANRPGYLLIVTSRSLISTGTERMLVEFGQSGLLAKAKSQPDKVRQVLDKMRTDGILPTLDAVRSKLDQPIPLGYCNAGVVLETGKGVSDFRVGDRVVSNGPHAEVVSVPQNLCAKIPEEVSDEEAAFAVLASVGLQGIRLANPTLGENVAVIGLGLVGLLTVQMLVANGCRVIGFDLDESRLALAREFGAEAHDIRTVDPVAAGLTFSAGRGIDAVLITASTKSNAPVHQAAQMSRKRGRIILVGVTGLELKRSDFYEKELSFQVSCSYGPGRYDPEYEQKGHDYPYGFVRWTAQRNFEAVLDMMARGTLDVKPLISQRISLEEAPKVYQELIVDRSKLGIIITYPQQPDLQKRVRIEVHPAPSKATLPAAQQATVGVIGAGNFATRTLLPVLAKAGVRLHTIAATSGTGAAIAARKFGFEEAASDYRVILENQDINTVFILTRHNTHARLVSEALRAGKHVFVEKPLAVSREELEEIRSVLETNSSQQFLVGFNRRFSPLGVKMQELLSHRTAPLALVYTVNAGYIPPAHWTQDPSIGGGRIIGEGCHFVDFLRFLVGYPIVDVVARKMENLRNAALEDVMSITLTFADGSLGTVHYFANGNKRFPKERVEVFGDGRVLVLDNFRSLTGYGWPKFRKQRLRRQDKGHNAEIEAFIARIQQGGTWLIPWEELEEVTLATFQATENARNQ